MKVKEFDIHQLEPWAPAVELSVDLLKTMKAFAGADTATLADLMVAVFMLTRHMIAVAVGEDAMTDDTAKLDDLLQTEVSSLVVDRCPELIEIESGKPN